MPLGDLQLPPDPEGLVLFCHGTGSDHHSPRNRAVARVLREAGLATWLLDLRGAADHSALEALLAAIDAVDDNPSLAGKPVGLFGASSGAAVALQGAAARPGRIATVVSRGGRPDLAGACLEQVRCPVLLMVGALDQQVLELNRRAATRLRCPYKVVLLEGAGHLFEQAGALEAVAELSRRWFMQLMCRNALQSAAEPLSF
jgi:pimeloyl-ACP methyl ester carboxylesterase